MKKLWTRTTPLSGGKVDDFLQLWQYSNDNQSMRTFSVNTRIGKPLDVVELKGTSLNSTREYAAFLRNTVEALYAPHQPKRYVAECPCCGKNTSDASEQFMIHSVAYYQCIQCAHVFVLNQPFPEALQSVFAESEEHSATYIDRSSIEIRLKQIVQPKLTWVIDTYKRHYGREPSTLIDVGAGGGHFLESCHRAGMQATGYEISNASRQFAREAFNIELISTDFLTAQPQSQKSIDVVCFWGLLEYTPFPNQFISAARRWCHEQSLLIVEVPRAECISSTIQKEFPDSVARHLDPTSHINCFSDTSLATLLVKERFAPVAAWYFGMDAFEMLTQLALSLPNQNTLGEWSRLIPSLQSAFDLSLLCDDIIVAAVPFQS